MARTSPIIRYKRKLISSIVNSPNLISLINSDYIEDGECVDSEKLVYKQIFPFYYIPDTQKEAKSYVIMKVNGLGMKNKIYNKAEVIICVISHQDIMEMKTGETRIDSMGEMIEELFNGRDDFGFGEMELKFNHEDEINTNHRCRVLKFVVEDFNADACSDE